MSIIAWIVLGLIAGAIAKFLMPGRDPGGCLITILIGIAGAFVARFVGQGLGFYRSGDDTPGFIASVLGAMLLLLLYRVIAGRKV